MPKFLNWQKTGSQEQRPRICRMQRTRESHPSDSVAQFWKVTTVIPFLDIVYSELKSRFSEDKRSHYELCALVPEVIITKSFGIITEIMPGTSQEMGTYHALVISFRQ